MLTLYTYYRSSAAFRVRIALALKGLDYRAVPVHLLRDGGEHRTAEFAARNPARLIPTLEVDGSVLTQSLAMLEFLEETHPEPPLLPTGALARARVRALALAVACDIHPLNNLRVLRYLAGELDLDEERRNAWYRHWVAIGFEAVEAMLLRDRPPGPYCHGERPGLADCCLVPQVFNARRFSVPLDPYPTVRAVHEACMKLAAFERAAPEAQADAE